MIPNYPWLCCPIDDSYSTPLWWLFSIHRADYRALSSCYLWWLVFGIPPLGLVFQPLFLLHQKFQLKIHIILINIYKLTSTHFLGSCFSAQCLNFISTVVLNDLFEVWELIFSFYYLVFLIVYPKESACAAGM